jgi:L-alanine-DL-glutamate epimerase-like enolase superfamily enzyme
LRITDVTTIKLKYDMPVPMADAVHYMPNRPTLLVQVHTDAGIVGLGEAAAYGGFLESTEALVIGELRETVLGRDPFTVERLWSMMAVRTNAGGAAC